MINIDLKNCPFCDSKAILNVCEGGIRVKCLKDNCQCQTPTVKDVEDGEVAVIAVTDIWNRREGI